MAPFIVQSQFSLLMPTNFARFIVSSAVLLRWLTDMHSALPQHIEFAITGNVISASPIERSLSIDSVQGFGNFIYAKDQIQTLINVLKQFSDQPLTIRMDDYLWIEHLMA